MPTNPTAAPAPPHDVRAEEEPSLSDRLRLADALVLVALLAPALSLMRWFVPGFSLSSVEFTPVGLMQLLTLGCLLTSPMVLMLMLALVILRRRRPQASWRALAREPGQVACLAVGLGLGVGLLMVAPLAFLEPWRRHLLLSGQFPWDGGIKWLAVVLPLLGSAVGSAWMGLYFGDRWEPRPTWIDRAGRLCGAYWLVATVILGAGLLHNL